VGANARQVTLVGTGEAFKEQCRNGRLQHGIAKELEALVVLGAGAAMRQRTLQQGRVGEVQTQSLLKSRETRIDHRDGDPVAGQLDRPSPEYLISR
jgi:hypothetical protein